MDPPRWPLTVFGLRRGPRSDHHGAVRPLSSFFPFPTFHAALTRSKVEHMIGSRAEAITPHTSSPEFSASLPFFKRGKIKRHCFTTNLSDDGMFRLVSVLCGWEFIADVFNPKQTECRNGGTQNWGFKCVILLCCLMSC